MQSKVLLYTHNGLGCLSFPYSFLFLFYSFLWGVTWSPFLQFPYGLFPHPSSYSFPQKQMRYPNDEMEKSTGMPVSDSFTRGPSLFMSNGVWLTFCSTVRDLPSRVRLVVKQLCQWDYTIHITNPCSAQGRIPISVYSMSYHNWIWI